MADDSNTRYTSKLQATTRQTAQLLLLKPALQRLLKIHVHGSSNLDNLEGAFAVFSNHSSHLDAPLITGATTVRERERLFAAFRTGEITRLVVSKVANFSVDLPEAAVAIQVSGSFGSRQEEAQRLGRLLRPKQSGNTASFYTLIARDTVDQDFAQNRQRFLAEQGYSYTILDADEVAAA